MIGLLPLVALGLIEEYSAQGELDAYMKRSRRCCVHWRHKQALHDITVVYLGWRQGDDAKSDEGRGKYFEG